MKIYHLAREIWLPRPLDEVFSFFSDALNLEALTPRWLRFQVLTPAPIHLQAGTLIDYRLRVRGLPLRWQSEITVWEPPHRFVDEQRRGPYRLWHHEHAFSQKDGGTLVADRVQYAAPGGRWVHQFLVKPDLERIFDYRYRQLERKFPRGSQSIGPTARDG